MENQKKIRINYSGSFVNTTEVFAWIFLILGVIGAFYIGSATENVVTAAISFIGSFIVFFILMVFSKLLKHVFYIRKIHEANAAEKGFIITEESSDFDY